MLLLAAPAEAQPADATSANALAERLFQDGRELSLKGDHEGACAKYAASLRLDATAIGTTLNLALCKEATGKLATAWGLYKEVASRSRGVRADRYDLATGREKELFPRLSSIVLEVPKDLPPGFTVRVDDVPLDSAAWGSPLPIDGGTHQVLARADGRDPFETKFTIAVERERKVVTIPALALAKAAAPPGRAAGEAPPAKRSQAAPLTLLGVGGAALTVGAVLGIDVLMRAKGPEEACPSPCVRGSGAALESQERFDALERQGLASTILIPAGAGIALAGLIWMALPESGAKAGWRPSLGGRGAGLATTF